MVSTPLVHSRVTVRSMWGFLASSWDAYTGFAERRVRGETPVRIRLSASFFLFCFLCFSLRAVMSVRAAFWRHSVVASLAATSFTSSWVASGSLLTQFGADRAHGIQSAHDDSIDWMLRVSGRWPVSGAALCRPELYGDSCCVKFPWHGRGGVVVFEYPIRYWN